MANPHLTPLVLILVAFAVLIPSRGTAAQSVFGEWITAREGQLYEGEKPFRFISFNIPNLAYTEDDMRFDQRISFRLPGQFEIDDALLSIQQMGGRVARTYTFSIQKTNDPAGLPRHILGPGKLNEAAMVAMDDVLASANRHGIRLIIPFVDNWSWWGGIAEIAAWRGKERKQFFTDPAVKEDYKQLVRLILERVNTRTGVPYKEDKAVLAWELGNELESPAEWVREMSDYAKSLQPKQLLSESYFTARDHPNVDIVQAHLYQGDPEKMLAQIRADAQKAAGSKVFLVGEFGFISTEGMRAVMDEIVRNPHIAGGLIWSLRFHNPDGGYYWHHEPAGGDFFKAYHWPGGPSGEIYDEARFMQIVRSHAFKIQGSNLPAMPVPRPPDLFSVSDGGVVTWRGATGAAAYDLQRAEKHRGPWTTVAWQLTADATQYRPLANDESVTPGQTYLYRLLARNAGGTSKPSKVFGPVTIRCRTLVDEMRNTALIYRKNGTLEIKSNEARNYKEDCNRLRGAPGAWIAYQTRGRIVSARVYAFGEKSAPALRFSPGVDGSNGNSLTPEIKDFNAGKDMYDFRWPRLYTLPKLSDINDGFSITFESDAQIGRIEVEYE